MTSAAHHALVVDDETIIRKLVVAALRKQGFLCDVATDGDEAVQMTEQKRYDAVITDLRMPNKNGHALILELLQQNARPVIVVLTGVVEPKIAMDLLSRGVDNIVFKPTDVALLAAKVKALVERQSPSSAQADHRGEAAGAAIGTAASSGGGSAAAAKPTNPALAPMPGAVGESADLDQPITLPELSQQLVRVAHVLPISSAALDVYNMTREYGFELSQIGAAIQRDASLAAAVLRMANSSLFNSSGQHISQLDEAVLRIGQQRVGELAVTASALAAATPEAIPWMDLELTWKRSMGAGIAIESLVEMGGHQRIESGLMLGSIMHPLGRIVLAMLFPRHYEAMIQTCRRNCEPLQAQERRLFPTNHAEIMAHLLATWRIPGDVALPLKYLLDDFSTLVRLAEPARTRAELVQLAMLVARFAAGRWEHWDLVRLPSGLVLKRLRVGTLREVVEQTRRDLDKVANFRTGSDAAGERAAAANALRPVPYCNLADPSGADSLAEMLRSMGLEPVPCGAEELRDLDEPAIVNCLGAPATRLAACRCQRDATVAVVSREKQDIVERFARAAVLPASYGRFREDLLAGGIASEAAPPSRTLVGSA